MWSKYFNNENIVKMNSNWISPKIIIGNHATGEFYYPRPHLEYLIWEEIEKGNHVLIAAPRRVGKTSVMLAMTRSCPKDTQCIFRDIEGIKSDNEFFKQFFELLVQCLGKFDKGKKWLTDFLKGINVEEVSAEGTIKFGDRKQPDYVSEISHLLMKLQSNGVKLVICLDELPQVLGNLHKVGKNEEAENILSHLREWRQNANHKHHFSLVLAGSVGIHHIVKTIGGRVADINDLRTIPFEPLTQEEADGYLKWATDGATIQLSTELGEYLLSKVNYYIPFFINLLLDEINKAARKINDPVINKENVDAAFEQVVKNSDHFRDWKLRLTEYFSKEDADFLQETLIFIAHKEAITLPQLYNLAIKHKVEDRYMELMQGLERDGYVVEKNSRFHFLSPFLKAFWKKDNPVYGN